MKVGARVEVKPGRSFNTFAAGDAGVITRVDASRDTCDVLFDDRQKTVAVRTQHLDVCDSTPIHLHRDCETYQQQQQDSGLQRRNSSLQRSMSAVDNVSSATSMATRSQEGSYQAQLSELKEALDSALQLSRRQEDLLRHHMMPLQNFERQVEDLDRRAETAAVKVEEVGNALDVQERRADTLDKLPPAGNEAIQLIWQAVRDLGDRLQLEAERRAALQQELLSTLGQGVQQLRSESVQNATDFKNQLQDEQQRGKTWQSEATVRQAETGKRVNELETRVQTLTRSVMDGSAGRSPRASTLFDGMPAPDSQSAHRLDTLEARHTLETSGRGTPRGSRAGTLGQLRGQLESLQSELAASASAQSLPAARVQPAAQEQQFTQPMPPVVQWFQQNPPLAAFSMNGAMLGAPVSSTLPSPAPSSLQLTPRQSASPSNQQPVIHKPSILVSSQVVPQQMLNAVAATPLSAPATPPISSRTLASVEGPMVCAPGTGFAIAPSALTPRSLSTKDYYSLGSSQVSTGVFGSTQAPLSPLTQDWSFDAYRWREASHSG